MKMMSGVAREMPAAAFRAMAYLDLTKPSLTLLALGMTLLGFQLGLQESMPASLLALTLAGTAFAGAGAAALNQFLEREMDARMMRTQFRSLPSGRLSAREALIFGIGCAATGTSMLFLVNIPAGLLGGICLVCYLFIYTPLKRRTSWCTIIGAIPGAIPPLIGWTAANGDLGTGGWILFLIVFFWQIPHFLAIAWLHRRDYSRTGFRVLTAIDETGVRTSRYLYFFLPGVFMASLLPAMAGHASLEYLFFALASGAAFLYIGMRFAATKSPAHAWLLFVSSILYLPFLGVMMLLFKKV